MSKEVEGWPTELDGIRALKDIIAQTNLRTVEQALAHFTVFTNPATVRETNGESLFPMIRKGSHRRKPGTDESGRAVYFDDNLGPVRAFHVANGLRKKWQAAQLNHIVPDSQNVGLYTNLRNLCLTPSWIAFLTDARKQHFCAMLEYRSFELYEIPLRGSQRPTLPDEYSGLRWADPLPHRDHVEARFRIALNSAPLSTPAKAAREIGWLFSNWTPDTRLKACKG